MSEHEYVFYLKEHKKRKLFMDTRKRKREIRQKKEIG